MTGISRIRADSIANIIELSEPRKESINKGELDIIHVDPDDLKKINPNLVKDRELFSLLSLEHFNNFKAFRTECCKSILPKNKLIKWFNKHPSLPCPHCKKPLLALYPLDSITQKKAIQNNRIYLFSMVFFASILIVNGALVIAQSFTKKLFYDNSIIIICSTVFPILGLAFSAFRYSKVSRTIEELV